MPVLTPEKIAEINELGEAEAQANYFLCAPPEFAHPFRVGVKRFGSTSVSMIPVLDHPLLNRILGFGMGGTATETMLDEAIAFLQEAGCKNYLAQVSPMALPTEYPEWLSARGFKPGRNWAKMYRGNEPAPVTTTDLRVEKIGKDQADDFATLVLPSFNGPAVMRPLLKGIVGQPGWHHYLAYAGDKPVSTAAMYVNGEVGWLGFASTHKGYRRRGGQGATFARRIQDGLAFGCKWFVTETGEDTPKDPNPSFHNMLRSGFQMAYLRRNYVHQSPDSPIKVVRRVFFVATYTLKYGWQRLGNR